MNIPVHADQITVDRLILTIEPHLQVPSTALRSDGEAERPTGGPRVPPSDHDKQTSCSYVKTKKHDTTQQTRVVTFNLASLICTQELRKQKQKVARSSLHQTQLKHQTY